MTIPEIKTPTYLWMSLFRMFFKKKTKPYGFFFLIPKPVQYVQIKLQGLGDFPGGAGIKNPPANTGDMGSSPGTGRSHTPRSN